MILPTCRYPRGLTMPADSRSFEIVEGTAHPVLAGSVDTAEVMTRGAADRQLAVGFGRLLTADSLPVNGLHGLEIVPVAPLIARAVRTDLRNNGSAILSSVRISANQGSSEP
jgi:hypothetical protein